MEIRITKSARVCATCERPFEHGEEIFSHIRIEAQVFVREDYDKDHRPKDRTLNAVAAWSTTYTDPRIEAEQPPEVFSPLRQAFYEAAEVSERTHVATAYLAAQLLRRQKVFRLIKEFDGEDGEMRIALFADRIGNRFIEVSDPSLSYEELEAGRQALLKRLEELEASDANSGVPGTQADAPCDPAHAAPMEKADETAG